MRGLRHLLPGSEEEIEVLRLSYLRIQVTFKPAPHTGDGGSEKAIYTSPAHQDVSSSLATFEIQIAAALPCTVLTVTITREKGSQQHSWVSPCDGFVPMNYGARPRSPLLREREIRGTRPSPSFRPPER